jgi:GNAT superfamily N-acetyltransferase
MMTPMPGSTSLRLIATGQQRHIVDRLWQLYRHVRVPGLHAGQRRALQTGRLPTFFEDPDRCGYLIYSGQALAGFALIRGLSRELTVVGEFFVVRAARRQRVGHDAAIELLRLHPGCWGIPLARPQGQGIGTALILACEQEARRRAVPILGPAVEVQNHGARRLYGRRLQPVGTRLGHRPMDAKRRPGQRRPGQHGQRACRRVPYLTKPLSG